MDGYSTFARAAAAYADLVGHIRPDQWRGPGLGVWDLRSLVGHGSRSLITVDTYLDRPATTEDVATSPEYYTVAAYGAASADPGAVAERGRQAGLALGDDPAGAVRALVERVLPRVEQAEDRLVETIVGGMRVSAYLPTRTFELVVHGFDVARAAELPAPEFDPEVLVEAATLAAAVAVQRGRGETLLMSLTGREPMPEGFSVV